MIRGVFEKRGYVCWSRRSSWLKRWPGGGWGFIHGPGSSPCPVLELKLRGGRGRVCRQRGKASAGKGRTLYSRTNC